MKISKREISSLVKSLRDFLKTFDKPSKCLQIPSLERKSEIEFTKSNVNRFARYYNNSIENPNRQIHLSFRLGNNNSSFFSTKKLEPNGNQFILREIVNLNHCEVHHHYKHRFYVAKKL